jgi:hypothetical protein
MKLAFLKKDLPKKRTAVTVAALALVAGVVAGRERPAIELIEARAPRPAAAAAMDDGIDLDKLRRGDAGLAQKDPFDRNGFVPKQAAVAAVNTAPAKPVAPPLPFQYFGRLTENGKTEVYVMRGEELLSLAPGQSVGDYRVEQISDASISFTYLPLKAQQTLELQ